MKNIIATLLLITLSSTILSGCIKPNDELATITEDSIEYIPKDISELSELNMGFDVNFPPYGFQNINKEYVGFDIDLAQEVCNRLEIKLIKIPIDWDSKDKVLERGEIDCIWNGFTLSESRADAYTWSDPYVDNSQVFLVNKHSGITTHDDLAGKVVAVQAGSAALEILHNENNSKLEDSFADLLGVIDYDEAFIALELGIADAVALDIGIAQYHMATSREEFLILEESLAAEVYAVGFLLGNTDLRDLIQRQLDEMMADGTFMQIAEKWNLETRVILKE
ncbi:MAG: transporter substrate-binding domain-containing protein [Eubacteriales bacterium]